MLGYPPKPSQILPRKEVFVPEEWIYQLKYRGWHIVVHDNYVYTRKGNSLPIMTGYPKIEIDYQLDGEIINPQNQIEHKVPTAIKNGTYKICIFDIFVPSMKEMILSERMIFLKEALNIYVPCLDVFSYEDVFNKASESKHYGYEGGVIKKKNGIYKISKHCSVIANDCVKVK